MKMNFPNKQTELVIKFYEELLHNRQDVLELKKQIEESIFSADVFVAALAEVEPIDWDFIIDHVVYGDN